METLTYGSHKKVWWICHICKYKYLKTVKRRCRSKRCPVCSGYVIITGINDLKSKFPKIAAEWDYEKNKVDPSTVNYRTIDKYWFKCPLCSLSYETSPNVRIKGHGCPYCAGVRLIPGKTDVLSYIKNNPQYKFILDEWDSENNKDIDLSKTGLRSSYRAHWICPNGHHFDMRIANRFEKTHKDCPVCSHRRILSGYNDLETYCKNNRQFLHLLNEWDYNKNEKKPSEVFPYSSKKFWWICPRCHNPYYGTLSNRLLNSSGCPNCGHHASAPELSIYNFIKNTGVKVLSGAKPFGFEYDIYLPDYKIAIEYDGKKFHDLSIEDVSRRENLKNISSKENNVVLFRIKETDIENDGKIDRNTYYIGVHHYNRDFFSRLKNLILFILNSFNILVEKRCSLDLFEIYRKIKKSCPDVENSEAIYIVEYDE